MDMNSLMKMMGKNIQQNPALNQLLTLKSMLDKLPREKQEEIVGNFVKSLEEAVKEQEGK
ncbi:MAG: hypothetical protein RR246_07090 [Clostridia bacterium]